MRPDLRPPDERRGQNAQGEHGQRQARRQQLKGLRRIGSQYVPDHAGIEMDPIAIRKVGGRRSRHQKQRQQRFDRPAVQYEPEQDRMQARDRETGAGEQTPAAGLIQHARFPDARPECPVCGGDEEHACDGDEAFHADRGPEPRKPSISRGVQESLRRR